MLNSINGKGTVSEDHPMNLGGLHGNGMPKIQQFYQTVDLMLAVGTRLRGQETGDFVIKLPPNIIQIDVDPLANGRTYANTYFVCGDAQATLEALLPRIEGRMKIDPAYRTDFATLKQTARSDFLATLGVYGTFPEQLRPVMPKDAIWVRDVTQSNTTWGNRIFPVYSPHQSVFPVGAGIGQGLSLGLGAAAAANGRKTVVMTGDGGFFLNVGELWTAVQEKLDHDRHRDERPRLRRDQAHPGRDRAGPPLLRRSARSRSGTACRARGHSVLEGRDAPMHSARPSAKSIAHKGPSLVEVDMTRSANSPPTIRSTSAPPPDRECAACSVWPRCWPSPGR